MIELLAMYRLTLYGKMEQARLPTECFVLNISPHFIRIASPSDILHPEPLKIKGKLIKPSIFRQSYAKIVDTQTVNIEVGAIGNRYFAPSEINRDNLHFVRPWNEATSN